ncbi:MAG: hypothetical protein ACPGES_00515 [Coraliomargarita sp.]
MSTTTAQQHRGAFGTSLSSCALTLATCVLLTTASLLSAKNTAYIDLYRVPDATEADLERIPKNLARWHMGASLVLEQDEQFQQIQVPDVGFFDESVFLSDNSALTYEIAQGTHNYIVDLGQFTQISRFYLTNESASGSFQLFSSDTLEPSKSNKWRKLSNPVEFRDGVMPSTRFPEIETRFVLVRFDISSTGLIGNFGITGPVTINQASIEFGKGDESDDVTRAQSPIIDYDFGGAHTGTRILYVSGGTMDRIFALIDEDPTTTYQFPTNEESVVVMDLRKATQMRSITAEYATSTPGTLQVYMVDTLPTYFSEPEKTGIATYTDEQGMLQRVELASTGNYKPYLATAGQEVIHVPESYFLEIEDSYSARIQPGHGHMLQIFDDIERRYVIYRFIPEASSAGTIKSAKFVPGTNDVSVYSAQASPTTFGGIQVIGDIEFDDIVLTMDDNPLPPTGSVPPNTPPRLPPPPPPGDVTPTSL